MKERRRFEIIKKVSEILMKFNIFHNIFFTVVDISLPKRKGVMKIYLSIFPEKMIQEVISYFNKIQKEIKNEIKKSIYLRHLPSKLKFFPSFEFKEAQEVFSILEKFKDEKNK